MEETEGKGRGRSILLAHASRDITPPPWRLAPYRLAIMSSLASGVAPASESSRVRQRHAPQGGKVIDRTTKAIQREPEPKSQAFYAPLVDTVWRVYVMASGILGTSVQEPVEILIMCMWNAISPCSVCLCHRSERCVSRFVPLPQLCPKCVSPCALLSHRRATCTIDINTVLLAQNLMAKAARA